MLNHWQNIGPRWATEKTCRVLEVLRENRIPFRMPSDDMFFSNAYSLPHPNRLWSVRVRRRDRERAIALLAGEGLVSSAVAAGLKESKTEAKKNTIPESHEISTASVPALPARLPL